MVRLYTLHLRVRSNSFASFQTGISHQRIKNFRFTQNPSSQQSSVV
ncbi:hypothetical protein HMPREF9370_2443 [Neisseria wadsworthii 9715]|uniref:Uncharacterized protein n=1 Tax=Neisseria wadsworthii 9715 TaxID=1030841 RepID=G4CTN3_9NEIS|nr:hypothetical protein HMPREF9370_2443 [Neisseria wadsworthii 9715]